MTFEDIAKTFTIKTLPDSEVELSGEIPFETVSSFEAKALEHLAGELELPGFRPGHVPADIAKKKFGDIAILEEAVELAMRELYPALIGAHTLDVVGRPSIAITKLAPGNPVGIVVKTTIYPAVALPKAWKKIGEGVELETVPDILDAEVDEALEQIRKARAKTPTKTTSEATPSAETDSSIEAKETSDSEASTTGPAKESDVSEPAVLPDLDDAFAQSLGNFTGLADLKVKLRENMQGEKNQRAREKRRAKIIETLIAKTEVSVPSIFVDSELEKIISQMKDDVTRFGMTFEGYLTQMKKTEDDLRQEFRKQAHERAVLQLALNKIAEDEKLDPDEAAIENEFKHALEHFPEARPDLLRIHIETVLRNEKVLRLLEGEDISTPAALHDHDHSDPNHTH